MTGQCEAAAQGIRCTLETGHLQPWSAAIVQGQRVTLDHNYGGTGPYPPGDPEPLRPGITAVLTAHPARLRNGLLNEALASVCAQTLQPVAIVVANDVERGSAASARRHALAMVGTEWLAWLDSDDYWYPEHLEKLMRVADETGAAFVFSWFDAPSDPLGHFGLPFDPAHPYHTTTVYLVKSAIAKHVGFSGIPESGGYSNDDFHHLLGICAYLVEHNLKAVHLAERTWHWRMSGQNTSGLPTQGDAV